MIRVLSLWLRRHQSQATLLGSVGLFLWLWLALPSQALAWSANENSCMGVNPNVATQVVSCGMSRGTNGGPNNPQWNVHFNLWLPPNTTAVSMGDSSFDDFGLVQAGGQDNRTYTGQGPGQCGTSATGSWRPISFTPGSYVGVDLVAIDTCGSFQTATVNFYVTLNLSPPTIDIKADGSDGPVVSPTGSVQLTWASTETTSCTGTGGWTPNGPVDLNGSTPAGGLGATPTTFTITCTGPNGVATDSVVVSGPLPAPTIASFTPTSGTTLGGTSVTIAGTNFVSGALVLMDGATTPVTAVTPTAIIVTTLAHAAGTVSVVVTNPSGQAVTADDSYTYVTPVDTSPTVTSITPNTNVAGSSAVLTGTNFTATGNSVLFYGPGNLPTTPTTTIGNLSTANGSTTSLGFTIPADAGVGQYTVKLENTNGKTAESVSFTVTAPILAAPIVTSVNPTSGSTLGGAVVSISGSNFVAGATVTVGGVAAAVSAVVSGSITITTPPGSVGAADVTVTNPDGQSATLPNAFVYTDLTTSSSGVTLVCATNDVGKQFSETFESFADGQTKDFGWQVVTPEQTTVTIRSSAGKTGNGLEFTDTNTTIGQLGVPYTMRSVKSSEQGSVSFDIQPKQSTGRFTTMLSGAQGTMMYVYLAPDGTLQAWNDAITTGSKYERIGSVSYLANEWANLKLDWNTQGVDVFWNGTKVNASRLPYSYLNNVTPVTSFYLHTGYEQSVNAFTGSYLIDNVVYPGCVSRGSMTINPTSGIAPLEVTASLDPPNHNLLNDPYTELNDVDAAAGTQLTTERNTETGVLTISNAPLAASCTSKSWLRDMDAHKGNQLQWQRTLPTKATVEAKIAWESDTTGLLQGFIGFIDADGFLHDIVGFNDGSSEHTGSLFAGTRNYTDDNKDCNEPAPGDGGWKEATESPVAGPTGSAVVKLVRRDKHVELYIDGKKLTEHEVTGEIAGIAIETAGLPGYTYGAFTIKSFTLTDDSFTWDFGDGSAKVTGERSVKHTYSQAGTFNLALTVGAQTVTETITVSAPSNTPTPQAQPGVQLVATGGSLAFNLLVAALLAIATTYIFLRRTSDVE